MFGKSAEITLNINGMSCGHCSGRVKKALESVEGVKGAEVDHETGVAVVSYKEGKTDKEKLVHSVLKLGYEIG